MIESSPLFSANYNATEAVVINQGGSYSGKTYSILQVLFIKAIEKKRRICVVAQDIPSLKGGVIQDAENIINDSPEIESHFAAPYHKTDRVYKFINGSLIKFAAFPNTQAVKNSGKWDIVFINEANGIDFSVFDQLFIRTKEQTFIDYNPDTRFWVHERVIDDPKINHKLIISDHRHNHHTPKVIAEKLEGLKEKDKNLFDVYARGKTGIVEGTIYKNWSPFVPFENQKLNRYGVPEEAEFVGWGLDLGYTEDPTAMVGVWKDAEDKRLLYVKEMIYSYGLGTEDMAVKMREIVSSKNERVISEVEPRTLAELTKLGVNVKAVKKGPGSVLLGIDILKRYHLKTVGYQKNLVTELKAYKHQLDKSTGRWLDEPIDEYNHLMDAMRYVALEKLTSRRKDPKYEFLQL